MSGWGDEDTAQPAAAAAENDFASYASMVYAQADNVGLRYVGLHDGIAEIGRVLDGDGELADEQEKTNEVEDGDFDEDEDKLAGDTTAEVPRLDLKEAQSRFQAWSRVVPPGPQVIL